MDITFARALAAAARAFADEIDRGLPQEVVSAGGAPAPGTARSMHQVLQSVAAINEQQARGVSDEEIRVIARRAGMDPRGMAGYYAASLLEKRSDGTRWVSQAGRDRLMALHRVLLVDSPLATESTQPRASRGPEHFDALYAGAPPPWDIGRPQPAFQHLAESGALRGRVLDSGCGTGEHALMAAALGLPVTGIDASPTAIHLAECKAAERQQAAEGQPGRPLDVRFLVWDALNLPALGEQFDTVLDSGLFHVFDDADRSRYVDSLRAVVAPLGHYYLLCFSERVPGARGPRRVSQAEIRASFGVGWHVDSITPATFEIGIVPNGAPAWLASIIRAQDTEKVRAE
ncbi:MAG TPA: class I SAM-dependent methyltransferase [Chloroflexota bacterium]|nr:class I SAM-dependent methyltransferase [Chloroflexota bacterium]